MNQLFDSDPSFDILRKYAETNRFSNGSPTGFKFVETQTNSHTLVFLRSLETSPEMSLWTVDENGQEKLLIEATSVASNAGLSELEATENERLRRTSSGITSFSVKQNQILFGVSGQPWVFCFEGATSGSLHKVPLGDLGYASNLKFSPDGTKLSLLSNNALHIFEASDQDWQNAKHVGLIQASDNQNSEAHLQLGVPEFVAAEEMGRYSGYWWVDDNHLLITEVDESAVELLNLSSPDKPTEPPRLLHYPYTGTRNALVTLYLATTDGLTTELATAGESSEKEYLVDAREMNDKFQVRFQNRAQTLFSDYELNLNTKVLVKVGEVTGQKWLDIVSGGLYSNATHTAEIVADDIDRSLLINGEAVDTPGYIRKLIGIENNVVYFTSSIEPSETHVFGLNLTTETVEQLSKISGINNAVVTEGQLLLMSRDMDSTQTTTTLVDPKGNEIPIEDNSIDSSIEFNVDFASTDKAQLAIFKPSGFDETSGVKLPVLLDPYGGPHAQRVIKAGRAHIVSQWFANQGYIVVVADGPGSPGVTQEFEFSIYRDLVNPILEGQISALEYVLEQYSFANEAAVGIRGWSFGGYLSALACIERPDLFHAGVAGAPVTDWLLYDTHYTERYLGNPQDSAQPYETSDLVKKAAKLTRPLMLIHGLSDDNVVPANSLKFSHELFVNDIDHELVTVTGLTHMPKRAHIVASLIKRQLAFLNKHLKSSAQ